MQIKRTRQSKPKLFQCTGFGDCRMVFTRSEHLARHSRKHTGEKPFKCIVPECTKSFSRFDNMMQHTQTHRASPKNSNNNNHHYHQHKRHSTAAVATSLPPASQTRSSTRMQKSSQQPEQKRELNIQTSHSPPVYPGLVSPVSLSSSKDDLSSDEDDYDEIIVSPQPRCNNNNGTGRRLSIVELCNPPKNEGMPDVRLTKDEFEALEAFGRFRHTPSVFFDSLRDLASIANIDYC